MIDNYRVAYRVAGLGWSDISHMYSKPVEMVFANRAEAKEYAVRKRLKVVTITAIHTHLDRITYPDQE